MRTGGCARLRELGPTRRVGGTSDQGRIHRVRTGSVRTESALRGSSLALVAPQGPEGARLKEPGAYFLALSPADPSEESAAMKASCGTSTVPMFFIRFLPSFCFSRSLRLREMSPP